MYLQERDRSDRQARDYPGPGDNLPTFVLVHDVVEIKYREILVTFR